MSFLTLTYIPYREFRSRTIPVTQAPFENYTQPSSGFTVEYEDQGNAGTVVFWDECQVILIPESLKDSFEVALGEIVLLLFRMNHDAFRRERLSYPLRRVQPGCLLKNSLLTHVLHFAPLGLANHGLCYMGEPGKEPLANLLRDSSVGLSSILPRIVQAWNRRKSFKAARSGTSTPLPRQRSLTVLWSGRITPLRIASSQISSSFHLELWISTGARL